MNRFVFESVQVRQAKPLEQQMAECRRERELQNQVEWIEKQPLWVQLAVLAAIGVGSFCFAWAMLWMTIRRW